MTGFVPKSKTPAAQNWQIRVNNEDLEMLKRIADETGESAAEIARQAIHYALQNIAVGSHPDHKG